MRGGRLAGVVALLVVTAVWGSTFPLAKDLLTRLPALDVLAVRSTLSAALLLALRPGALRGLDARTCRAGALLGVTYGAGLTAQSHGLVELPAAVSGFVTGSYVVMTPLLGVLWLRTPVAARTWAATALAATGLVVLALPGRWSGPVPATGLTLTVAAAALYAVHVVMLGRVSRPGEAYALTTVQAGAMGAALAVAALPGGLVLPGTGADWAAVGHLAVLAGAVSSLAQTWAQARVPAATAAVVMSVEPVWATVFAVLVYGEAAGWPLLVGGGCVLAATVLVTVPSGSRPARDRPVRDRVVWESPGP
ncbi:drug/metabolite transporter (DMT)-like permease [Streptosporangium becharense]|uniref:Drug/metabolite transporter (DMT)-like permease n=1 Tax=Streptosporangium becharense TaxID=1816182 RepID=A0A7W9IMM1_9ACTN|nr:DMT family transporter [Streptosporangium becharense]MBB2914438.1 drug/metabolite transporter (DMT)-like permease [Streptosporangium becharense]MBB5823530.1 drug/metabolite transporter (DMT)-like permease [Streptosporangium becharense]